MQLQQFIQVFMTSTLDAVTGETIFFDWVQVAQATTQTQAEQNLLIQLWSVNLKLLEGESRTGSVEKNLRRVKLLHGI